MGPVGFSVNVIDPNLVSRAHDGILQVRINSEAQKWGGWRTYPNREAKWGRSVQQGCKISTKSSFMVSFLNNYQQLSFMVTETISPTSSESIAVCCILPV